MSQYNLLKTIPFNSLTSWSIKTLLGAVFAYNKDYKLVSIKNFLTRNKTPIEIKDDESYKRVTIKLYNGGIFLRDVEVGKNIGTKKQFVIKQGQFLLSKIDARNGAFGVVTQELNDGIITGNFWTFDVDYSIVDPYFLSLVTTTKEFNSFCNNASTGTTNRHYLQEEEFLAQKIPLLPLDEQKQLVQQYQKMVDDANNDEKQANDLEKSIETYLYDKLGISKNIDNTNVNKKLINFVPFSKMQYSWTISSNSSFASNLYDIVSLSNGLLLKEIFRGKSPKYADSGKSIVINQKCNRWDSINLNYAKKVDGKWLNSVDEKFLTKQDDVLINSTGEGTIGRSSVVMNEFSGLLYDSHVLLIRLNKELVNSKYLVIFINSSLGQQQISLVKSANSTKQTELGIDNCKKILFPLPPIEEQNKIVDHITSIKNEINKLKQQAEQNKIDAITNFEKEIFHHENHEIKNTKL